MNPEYALKKTPVKTGSGDLVLVPLKAGRYLALFMAAAFQCLLIVFVAKGVQLIMTGNLAGIILILFFAIPGSAIIWFNYYQITRFAAAVHIDPASRRLEIEALPFSQAATLQKYKQEAYCFPFQDIDSIQLLPATGGIHIVGTRINYKNETLKLCSLPVLQARHLARHMAGVIGCGIQLAPGDAPLFPLPVESPWDPEAEREEPVRLSRATPYPAILFCCLVLAAAVFKFYDRRPPIWFYLGIHFQIVLSVAGVLFFIKGQEILTTAWGKLKYIFFCLFSLFLCLSLFLPSRGLFPLFIACLALLIPVVFILRAPSTGGGKAMSTLKTILILLIGIIVAAPLTGYGYLAIKNVYGFFAQPGDDITGIAFYKIKPPRQVDKTPVAIVRQADQINGIMRMLQQSVSQHDPRRVERNYLIQIKHRDGTSYFASIGRMKNNRGCILFSSRYGLWGWEFGGYDNPRMISVLKQNPGLWPD